MTQRNNSYSGEWEASVEDVEASQTSEPLYTILVKQKKRTCQQILPFNNKSKFKLTQFNLNSEPQQTGGLLCICANKKGRYKRTESSPSKSRSGSTTSASNTPQNQPSQLEVEHRQPNRQGDRHHTSDESVTRIDRTESKSSYESLTFENSYRSLRPHSILLSNTSSVDTLSVNSNTADTSEDDISRSEVSIDNESTNTLMFTPDPEDSGIGPMDTLSIGEGILPESDVLPQPVEVGNSLFYRQSSIEVGNSLFYRRTSNSEVPSLSDQSALSSVDQLSVASESTLSGSIISDLNEQTVDPETMLATNESETFSLSGHSSRVSDYEGPPTLNDDLSTLSLREEPPSLDSDEDTISVTSQDFPPNFMFDDIFCSDNRNSRSNSGTEVSASEVASLEDTPSTKVRRFLSIYTDDDIPPPMDSNQSDDEKIKNLSTSRCGSTMSNTTSISIDEEGVLSDSSLEDLDPYLVVDIQSLPSQFPANQLAQAAHQADVNAGVVREEAQECLLHAVEEEGEDDVEVEEEVQTGWIITHTLEEMKILYLNLKGCKSAGYPSSFPVPIPKDSTQMLDSKEHVGDFLNFVLRDKTLSQSEHVYRSVV